jgi:uncharacterized membrane protein YkvA (DUF1232 family)
VASDQTITIELNPGERRLWDRMRAHVVSHETRESTGIRDLIVLLPDLSVLLMRLLRDDRVPIGCKAIAVAGVAYVISPLDFLPALLFGPIGLVDDLIIVATALSAILNHVHPDVVRSHWSGQGDALDAIRRVTGWFETQVTSGLRSAFSKLARR